MKIAFLQVVCPTYKVSIFNEIKKLYNIDFYIGDCNNSAIAPNSDSIPFSYYNLKNVFFKFAGVEWLIQRGFNIKDVRKYDLIILPLSVPNLINFKIIFLAKILGVKIGFYGMGINYQKRNSNSTDILEKIRRFLIKRSDFTVVYTDSIKQTLIENGINSSKIFVAPNTLDVNGISEQYVNEEEIRKQLDIGKDKLAIVYVGRLSKQKNPLLLLEAYKKIIAKGISVKLIFVGDGEEIQQLKNESKNDPSIIFCGNQSEEFATKVLKVSDFCIIPGMTGLAVVHSYACRALYITVESPLHSPEFDYIQNGKTAVVVASSSDEIADKVIELYYDEKTRLSMVDCAFEYALQNLSLNSQLSGFDLAIKSLSRSQNYVSKAQ